MYGDISRPFDSGQNITRVIFNQGKPVFEADLNEAINAAHECHRLLADLVVDKPTASRIGKWMPIDSMVKIDLWSHGLSVNDRVHLSFDSADIPSAVFKVTNLSGDSFQVHPSILRPVTAGDVVVTPIADPFRRGLVLGVEPSSKKIVVTNGVIYGGGIIAQKQGHEYATNFVPINIGGSPGAYRVQFDPSASSQAPTDGDYVVCVAMQDRPLLLSEMDNSKSFSRNARSAEFRLRELEIVLEPVQTATSTADDVRNEIEGRNSHMEPPSLKDISIPKRVQGRVLRLEVHSLEGSKCLFKIGVDNAFRCVPAKGPLNNLEIEKEFLKDMDSDLLPAYVELERKDDLRWVRQIPNDLGTISTDWKSVATTSFRDSSPLSASPPPSSPFQDQLRLWQDVFEITSLTTNGTHEADLSVKFNLNSVGTLKFTLASDNSARWLRRGDYWLVSYDQSAKTWTSVRYRKQTHFAPIGTVTFASGNPSTFSKYPRFATNSEVEKDSLDHFDTRLVSTVLKNRRENEFEKPQMLGGISCSQLISRCDYPPIQRWLSSMTLDEISKLSFEQLRHRILEDCRINSSQIPIVESNVRTIIADRDQWLQHSASHFA